MKKIALSSCFMYPDSDRNLFRTKTLSYMEGDMARLCSHNEHLPILIPDLPDEKIKLYLSECSGLVLAGGSDVSPESYNEPFLDKDRWPGDKYRDDYEFRVLKLALELNLPVLGICRGAQILNSYFGGTLYQDLEIETKTKVEHRNASKYDKTHHQINITGDVLKDIYKKESIEINSVHHQGINKLADCFNVEAISPVDSLIEAFSHKKMKEQFILGVQWHPEFNPTLKDVVESELPLINYYFSKLK